ncbi:MAG: hypothetical protein IPG53_13290 [Ignavibacteriales bacterium]|nr:hypothetical protein [Ignavibacteriales bacterium]
MKIHPMAPMFRSNLNGSYTAYVFYNYPAGYTGYFPNGEALETQPAVIYAAGHTFTATGVEDGDLLRQDLFFHRTTPEIHSNPTTSINFTVAQRSNVTLKVYDMLGREVASLVNEVKDQGSYNVNFDAAKLASEPMFTNLHRNFIETKNGSPQVITDRGHSSNEVLGEPC